MATLIVLQDIVEPPDQARGGMALLVLQWLKAFERAGHDVVFLNYMHCAYDQATVRRFEKTISRWWDARKTALIDCDSGQSLYGLADNDVREALSRAAAAIVIGWVGWTGAASLVADVRPRILIEYDPAYTQLWAELKSPQEIYGVHDAYYSVGANIGTARCRVPTHGIDWKHTWNPVVLDWWRSDQPVRRDRFTTVADWRAMGYLEYEGKLLGPKADEFKRFIDVPRLAGESPEIVLDIEPGSPDIALLEQHGWILEKPDVASDPEDYREYIASSRGEFSCAKGVYVGTRCGWFGDRSSCYLAAGRPVVMQSTGFEDVLPTGRGLFAVSSAEEAAEAMRAIRRDYALHSTAARRIAQEYFDSDRIASRFLAEAGI